MRYLFSENGRKLLEALSFTRTLYAFDFDGTLAPIVPVPESARMRPLTGELLRRLGAVAPVAVISGRSLRDLRAIAGPGIGALVGNHGIEGLKEGEGPASAAKRVCEGWKSELRPKLRGLIRLGVQLEDKEFSLALHFRGVVEKRPVRDKLLKMAGELSPEPRVIGGKLVLNLLPPGTPHKGAALLRIMERAGASCALYIGDDDTDEDVFSLSDRRVITVRVGSRRDSQAQFFIRNQSEINRLLKELLSARERLLEEAR